MPYLRPEQIQRHRSQNLIQTLLLLLCMGGLLLLLGAALGGQAGVLIGLFLGVFLLTVGPQLSGTMLLRRLRAVPLGPRQAPGVVAALAELSRRAGLRKSPQLYYVPSAQPNALAVGASGRAAVAVTDGLLRRLTPRELTAVLAHEMGHIRNRDLYVMALADFVSRTTQTLSLFGKLLLLLNLPLLLSGRVVVPFTFVLLLVFAPTIAALLQLALSRTREFDADLEAVRLTGDPQGLASALVKLEQGPQSLWRRVLFGGADPTPSYLRTHPRTEERLKRLQSLVEPQRRPVPFADPSAVLERWARPQPRRSGYAWLYGPP